MPRWATGLLSLCLVLWLAGCGSSAPQTVPVLVTPMVPTHLTRPLPRPQASVTNNRGLLDLLAEYDGLLRRANADRAAVVEILSHDAGDEE